MVKRFNPDKRRRPKVDDHFGDWKWREALAESMVPIIGKLFRNGVHLLMYGRPLINCSAIEIMKLHRFVREAEGNELSELETYPIIEQISKIIFVSLMFVSSRSLESLFLVPRDTLNSCCTST